MSRSLLILRPRPGADETAARARAMGLTPVVAPLFAVRPIAWTPPPASGFDALMLTSANAPRHAGAGLAAFRNLPCYAVGEASAAAGREAGLREPRLGPGDGRALLATMAADGIGAALHLCGRDRIALHHPDVAVTAVPVYAADPVSCLPAAAAAALAEGALALLHSPRAAALLRTLAGDRRGAVGIAAISPETAAAAGDGWRNVAVAARPRDQALLELAASLCQTALP